VAWLTGRPLQLVCGAWLAAPPLLVLPAAATAKQPSAASPAGVVRAFYHYHFAHDMAFTPVTVRRRAPWLAPELLALCRAYFAAPAAKDEVPAIDGDPFTDSQEYPTSFRVGAAQASGDSAVVTVTFAWSAGETRGVTVVLTRRARGWRIADLRYEGGDTFRSLLSTRR